MIASYPYLLIAALMLAATPAGAADWATVEREPRTDTVRLDGTIEAVRQSTVSAQTAGTIVELPFDVDDVVEAGALIARLEDTEQRARLEQAQANLAEARASLEDARQQFRRIEPLAERGVASQADLDQARNALNAARARVSRSESAMTEAREQLDYTRVSAPYAGVITARHVEIGESVRPGQPLLSGFALAPLRAVASVPQRFVDALRGNPDLHVELDSGRALATGRVVRFPFAGAPGHGVTIRIALDERADGIYPGQMVRVLLPISQGDALWIPADSLLRRSELRAVFVRGADGQPRLRQVRVGARQGDRFEVLAGLAEGEAVALDPESLFARDDVR